MMKSAILAAATLLCSTIACPDHLGLRKRADNADFDYAFPDDWAELHEDYQICKTSTQQTPIDLFMNDGAASRHTPFFHYPNRTQGLLVNFGTSISWTLEDTDNNTALPSLTFSDGGYRSQEHYFAGWHLHAPSEHHIDGRPAAAEMHMVHADADGNYASVLAFIIQPAPNNTTQSRFFNQLRYPLPSIGSDEGHTLRLDLDLAIQDVGGMEKFWSYKGSLTTPPCSEGLRWWIAQQPLYVDDDTLQEILRVSSFSARPVQMRWRHGVNE